MAKYPGSFIINEVGTRKELAGIYGVSERTIYRWLNRAAKESGQSPHPKKAAPTPAELAAFKGTRAQLAESYGVSPRTAYRWLAKARQDGTVQDNRRQRSKYPGSEILNISGTNKEIAEIYDVSPRTVSRWKRKARLEKVSESQPVGVQPVTPQVQQPAPQQPQTIEEYLRDAYEPENIIEPPEEYIEPVYEEPIEAPEEQEEIDELFEVESIDLDELGISEDMAKTLTATADMIEDLGFIDNDIYNDLTPTEKLIYLNSYLEYKYNENPYLFYNKETHSFDFSPDYTLNHARIWGDFDSWIDMFQESQMYEI